MRRLTAGITLVVTIMSVAGCIESSSSSFSPKAGVCHQSDVQESDKSSYAPISCDLSHEAETVYVGVFNDEKSRPTSGTAARSKAFAACDAAATTHVGKEWRGARLLLRLVIPTAQGWTSGERWFRCDLSEVSGLAWTDPKPRIGSLGRRLREQSDLPLGCLEFVELADGRIDLWGEQVPCTAEHNGEFAGVWHAPEMAYSEANVDGGPSYDACSDIVEEYVRMPDAGALAKHLKAVWFSPGEAEWLDGDRGVRCFLWTPDHKITRSLRGAGPEGLSAALSSSVKE